jgi:hypothetical protein
MMKGTIMWAYNTLLILHRMANEMLLEIKGIMEESI